MPTTTVTLAYRPLTDAHAAQQFAALLSNWKQIGLLAAGLLIIGSLAVISQRKAARAELPQDSEEEQPVQVTVVQPAPAGGGEVLLPATVRPWQSTTLQARVTGYIKSWRSELGTHVTAGEVLAELETPELDQEVAQAEAQALEAESATVQAKAEHTEAEADLKVATAQLARVQAEADLAKTQLARRERLLVNAATSQEERDTFQKQWEARTADVAAAEADLARRRTNLETREAIIAAREATAKSRWANVERLRELQAFKQVVAPFDGVITARSAEVGMLITAGKEALFAIQDMSRVRVQVNVPQANASMVGVDSVVRIIVPEGQSPPLAAQVTRIASSLEATTRTMLAEIELDNRENALQPGSYVQVGVATKAASGWVIPTNTLLMRVDGPHVVTANDPQVALQPVKLGRNLGKCIEVSEGIDGHEWLIVNPTNDLSSGTRVRINRRESVAQR
jgi:multidrug efflux pump subunit AcrA (membrane-fusion protein)